MLSVRCVCSLFVVWLFVVCCVCFGLINVRCVLFVVRCLLFVVCRFLVVGCWLMFGVICLLFVGCSLFVVRWQWRVVRCSLRVACGSRFECCLLCGVLRVV